MLLIYVQLNKQYSIVTDIRKTYVKEHRIPIDEELSGILAVLIDKSKNIVIKIIIQRIIFLCGIVENEKDNHMVKIGLIAH